MKELKKGPNESDRSRDSNFSKFPKLLTRLHSVIFRNAISDKSVGEIIFDYRLK